MAKRKPPPPEERRIYRPADAKPWTPRSEWVEMQDGRWLCVRQLSVAENLHIGEYSQRHPNDPRPGPNETEQAIWQVAFSCYDGNGPEAQRVYTDIDARRVLEMDPVDFKEILVVSGMLLGLGREAMEARENFTPAAADSSLPRLRIGA